MHIGATFNRRNHPHTIVRQVLENLNAFIVHRFCLFNASSGGAKYFKRNIALFDFSDGDLRNVWIWRILHHIDDFGLVSLASSTSPSNAFNAFTTSYDADHIDLLGLGIGTIQVDRTALLFFIHKRMRTLEGCD